MKEMTIILLLITSLSILLEGTVRLYRWNRRRLNGPSEKEFVWAMNIITLFINHHNKETPNGQIKSITVFPTGDLKSELSEAHE